MSTALADPAAIVGDEARIAFWLNTYNETLLAELRAHPRRGSLLLHRRMFRKTSVELGGQAYSLDVIEHGLLRGNARPPGSFRRLLAAGDLRLEAAPGRVDPRIHFALNCGARSCPPVRAYDTDTLDSTLDAATRAYLEAESSLDTDAGTLTLPGLMKLYRHDFGDGSDGALVEFAAPYIGASPGPVRLRFARFDWRFAAAE